MPISERPISEQPADNETDRPTSKPQPLYIRMYFQSHLTDLVRLVGYGGLPLPGNDKDFQGLIDKHGEDKMRAAAAEITILDQSAEPPVVRLTEQARKVAFQLLGPPPREDRPKQRASSQTAKRSTRPASADADPALTRLNRRQLRCRLRDARQRLEHNGKRSVVGKLAKKDIAAVEAEMHCRGMDIPAPGLEDADAVDANAAAVTKAAAGPRQDEQRPQAPATMTPLLRQYREAKERHPGMILLFHVGDFYELFEADAETGAKLLGLTLTSRDNMAMAGFPKHALESYLRKLLQAGQRVAICEEIADVHAKSDQAELTKVGDTETKLPVTLRSKRGVAQAVTRIVSPGTLIEPTNASEPTTPDPANVAPADVATMSAEEEFDLVFEAVQEAVQATAREMFSEPGGPDGPGGNKLPETSPSQADGPARRRPRTRPPTR